MRELTNKNRLPEPIVAAVSRYATKYDRGGAHISATQLGEPPRIIALKNRHGEEIVEDVADRLYVLDGHIVHEILEHEAKSAEWDGTRPLVEHRLHAEVNGWDVSGQVDIFAQDTGVLSDYKRVSIAQRKRGSKEEWVWQLNALAFLLRENGYSVNRLEAVRWYRDWSLRAWERETDYPDCAIETIEIPMWSPEDAAEWVKARVELHQLAAMVADDAELPPCSEKERWNPGALWAVMKPGRQSALRVLSDEAEAALWMAHNAPGVNAKIVVRPGENIRCRMMRNEPNRGYCSVWKWCDIGRQERQNTRVTEEVKVTE